ncbi:hypothetical protein RA180_15130 [Aeromonas salmonicida]|uniref:hypothetical protein n=1 Tax=Aeromonas salmonicida TaxID=645 RepID=UPI002796BA7E|nr:hypothetical protein [Aeromonas salmonicida]MDQ1885322.1 hypothetical protein [Aeromonas salmonicida]
MFQVGITLGRLGGAFELKVGYSHLSEGGEGFGLGWSLNLSRYYRAQKRLTLSDGRSYRMVLNMLQPEVQCQYLKLQDIKVMHQNGVLRVTYKDGTVEQFDINGYLRSVTSPSGHVMTFTYRGGRLERVTNQSNLSLRLDYSEGGVIVTDSNGKDRVRVRVSVRLTDVTLPDDTSYRIGYRTINGLYVVEYLYHPTGATEKLTYDATGMRLPAGGPVSGLPAVTMRETYGWGVPRMTRNYRYSGTNFLGNGLSRYTADVDNLFETASNYTYSCTEVFGDKEVTQTYNKYHLLTEESVLVLPGRQLMQKTVVEYYADTSNGFTSQPDQYLLPRKQTVTYYNLAGQSRAEVTEFEYDSYGNELRQLDAFGIETRSVYYPATGESGAAPAAPAGIPCLLKSQTVTPSARNLKGGEVAKISTHTYDLHPALQGGKNYPVEVKERVATANGRELSTTTFTYVNNPSMPESHGAPLRTETREGELTTIEVYSYSLQSGVSLSSVETCTFGDGLSYTEEQTICLRSGKLLAGKDRLGNQATWEYDGLGRVVKEVVRVGSEFEQTTTYRYVMGENSRLDIEVSDGTRRQVSYDKLGREVANSATDCGGNLVLMSKQTYNAQGQVSAHTVYDDFGGGEVGLTTALLYDIWGEVSKELLPSNEANVTERDKANNTQIRYTMAGGQRTAAVTTYYDERGEVIKEVSVDSEATATYNGFGLEVARKNPFNVKTTLELDDIGRAVSERTGTITTGQAFTSDNRALVTELTVAGSVVGRRQYDALNRVASETRGGMTTLSRYDTLADKPSVITLPGGDTVNYTLSLVLGEVTDINTKDGRISYGFDASGRLTRASNSATTLQCTYYPNGLLKSESILDKTASYTYSRQGQLLTLTDYMGSVERRSYDGFQRLQTVTLGQITVTLSYDAFGRLQQESITSPTNPTLVHQYSYDTQGRLTDKKTTSNGVHYLAQAYSYDKGMRLASKTVTDASGSATTENYRYDDLGRVTEVRWSGGERPDYLGVGAMLSQSFTFDTQGNITEVDTLFAKGSEQGSDKANYQYDNGRLLKVSHSLSTLPASDLTYDGSGNLTRDEEGRRYSYNVQGQLTRIEAVGGATLSAYTYSANGLQVKQSVPEQPDIALFYGLGHLLNESQGTVNSRILIIGGRPISRLVTAGGVTTETGLVTDYKGSVLREVCGQASTPLVYTPHGEVTGKTAGRKQLVAVTPYPGDEQDYAIYYWSDGSYSTYYIPGGRFNRHYGVIDAKVIANWPVGKQLSAVTAYPGYEESLHLYCWSDGSYSTYDVSKRSFNVHYGVDAAKLVPDWPAGKVLVAAVTAWGVPGYVNYFWRDGGYSDVDIRSAKFTNHYSDTRNFKGWGWPDGKQLVTVVTAWGKTNLVHYYWHDGSYSEFDTARHQFTVLHSAMEDEAV